MTCKIATEKWWTKNWKNTCVGGQLVNKQQDFKSLSHVFHTEVLWRKQSCFFVSYCFTHFNKNKKIRCLRHCNLNYNRFYLWNLCSDRKKLHWTKIKALLTYKCKKLNDKNISFSSTISYSPIFFRVFENPVATI